MPSSRSSNRLGIAVLDSSGHISITWDPADPDDVARARGEVDALRAAGYSFFVTGGGPADEVAAGNGKLEARRVHDPVTELTPAQRGREKAQPTAVAVRPMRGG